MVTLPGRLDHALPVLECFIIEIQEQELGGVGDLMRKEVLDFRYCHGISQIDSIRIFISPDDDSCPASSEGLPEIRLLPALVERDLDTFGAALTEAQELVGTCFAAVQNGLFHPDAAPLIARLKEAGARGVGQSSWGPAVYAFGANEAEERRLLDVARRASPEGSVFAARGWNRGAALESA